MSDREFTIMVVDDDNAYAETCCRTLIRAGYRARSCGRAVEALQLLADDVSVALILTDLKMPGLDGIEFLKQIKAVNPAMEVIIMTGYGTIQSAVKAIKNGAIDYITKPFDRHELLNAVTKVHRMWQLQKEVTELRQQVSERLELEGFVFKSDAMTTVYNRIASAARCHCSVFIAGESGTGKELVARAIHRNSLRAGGPFVPINCSALPGELIESELFGYRKGAFTGATRDYDGLFVAADRGTLFLDEIADMEQNTQSKLLRSIQERAVRPVGSVEERPVDVRFIAATNRRVAEALKQKRLREDLYHRLNVIYIGIPPLRDLADEIPELVNYLLERKGEEHGRSGCRLEDSAMRRLCSYSWPGNIREAINLVERCLLNADSEVINSNDLPVEVSRGAAKQPAENNAIPSFTEAERDLILRALREARGNKSKAAQILGISRPRLYKKIQMYGIDQSTV